MNKPTNWPSDEEMKKLPIIRAEELTEHVKKEKQGGNDDPKVLVDTAGFLKLLRVFGKFRIKPRFLAACARLGLVPPPVRRDDVSGQDYYIFPDHLEEANIVLTLRYWYQLPLESIREIMKHFPVDSQHLIFNRRFAVEDLLDLSKMLPRGFKVEEFVMLNACDRMIQDLLPPNAALLEAMKPGDELYETEEKFILQRLDEAKAWVQSGRMREYLKRESKEDIRNVILNQLTIKKIALKMSAREGKPSARQGVV